MKTSPPCFEVQFLSLHGTVFFFTVICSICKCLYALTVRYLASSSVYFLKTENQTLRIMKPMNKVFPRASFGLCLSRFYFSDPTKRG